MLFFCSFLKASLNSNRKTKFANEFIIIFCQFNIIQKRSFRWDYETPFVYFIVLIDLTTLFYCKHFNFLYLFYYEYYRIFSFEMIKITFIEHLRSLYRLRILSILVYMIRLVKALCLWLFSCFKKNTWTEYLLPNLCDPLLFVFCIL